MVKPESDDDRHWCMMRAHRAFGYMDRVGMDRLARSQNSIAGNATVYSYC